MGRLLYSTLFEILKRQGFRNVYAVINLPNEKSVAFHERLSFTYFATHEQVGYKLGKWKMLVGGD
ncbi:MAG: GNAT family N-acetyltransferase [Chitinophagaceae bacterium]|nr:GNAT family N-acetyltransferase [Chitinophagaceae bacterium]